MSGLSPTRPGNIESMPPVEALPPPFRTDPRRQRQQSHAGLLLRASASRESDHREGGEALRWNDVDRVKMLRKSAGERTN